MPEFSETICDGYLQQFMIDELLFEAKTGHQQITIFHNRSFGRVLALDGVIQTTERDEFIYHEMMSHVPILAHGDVRRVLIVGGADGAMLREVLRHKQVSHVTQVEIDGQVIDMCRRYLPNHSQGAYDDPRARVVIDDGLNWVNTTQERYDVIISDNTDPVGPGEALFDASFYAGCRRCLRPGGVLVTQNGVVFLQLDVVRATAGHLRSIFADWHFYSAAIPTYAGGAMTFAWASDDPDLRRIGIDILADRYGTAGISTRYYNPETHHAAFALPQYILEAIGK